MGMCNALKGASWSKVLTAEMFESQKAVEVHINISAKQGTAAWIKDAVDESPLHLLREYEHIGYAATNLLPRTHARRSHARLHGKTRAGKATAVELRTNTWEGGCHSRTIARTVWSEIVRVR
jgi:hypothetical protein